VSPRFINAGNACDLASFLIRLFSQCHLISVRGGDTVAIQRNPMPTLNLSKRGVDTLRARAKTYVAYDLTLFGFGCRVTTKGAKSWVVEYRPNGGGRRVSKRRMTLGPVTTLPPDAARRAAREILARARLGEDVAQQRTVRRASLTVAELAARYLREEVGPTRKASTTALYEMYFRRHILPEFASVRAIDLTHADVAKLHRKIGESAPVTANRVVTLLSGLFSWAAKVGEVPEDRRPTRQISRFREEGCERYLTEHEFGRLGEALREAETVGLPWDIDETRETAKHAPKPENRRVKISPFATAAIRLLLFTGCRLREILHLQWNEVDFERGMLFLADSKTGRKPVILSLPALAVLTSLPQAGRYVIAGNDIDRPRHDLQKPWAAVAKRAGFQGVRLHDLRHSFAAVGAGGGFGLPIIGKLLGHRNLETTNRYAHIDHHPLRIAANSIADQIAHALGKSSLERHGQGDALTSLGAFGQSPSLTRDPRNIIHRAVAFVPLECAQLGSIDPAALVHEELCQEVDD
jgi:integrase